MFTGLSAIDFLSDADTKVAYSQEITRATTKKSKVQPFIGVGETHSNIINSHKKTCVVGDYVGVPMVDELIESGATGNVDFSASSEELKEIKQFIKVDRYQHSTPSKESVVNQRASEKFKKHAKPKLTNWSTLRFDKIFFHQLSADCTNVVVSGHHEDASSKTSLVKADVLTTADVEEAKRRAQKGLDAQGNEVPPLIPIRIEQSEMLGYYEDLEFFAMFVGTDSARNIKNDPNWEAARAEAYERGKNHPLFSGALGMHDGVALFPVKTDTAREAGVVTSKSKFVGFGNVKTCDLTQYEGSDGQETEVNLFVGAHAAQIVVDEGIAYYEWADKDDPRRMHAGIDRVYGFAKTKFEASTNDGILKDSIFDGKDYGVIAVVSSTGK